MSTVWKCASASGRRALLAGDAAQLEMRVGFGGIDGHGGLKPADGFGILAPLLVDQPELVLRFAIVRVDGRDFQHAAEMLAAAQAAAQTAQFAAQIVEGEEQEEGRGHQAQQHGQRSPEKDHRHQRNPGQPDHAGGGSVSHPEHRAHRRRT